MTEYLNVTDLSNWVGEMGKFYSHLSLGSFSSLSYRGNLTLPGRIKRVLALNTVPCDGWWEIFPLVLSNFPLWLVSHSPVKYRSRMKPQEAQNSQGTFPPGALSTQRTWVQGKVSYMQTELSPSHGVSMDLPTPFSCLTHRQNAWNGDNSQWSWWAFALHLSWHVM